MNLSGHTKPFAVLGHPIGHTLSPVMHNASMQELAAGIDGEASTAGADSTAALANACEAGATEDDLAPIRKLQRKAMWRLDYIVSENSKGFHASQESARILGESIDYSRQAIAASLKIGQ